MLDEDINFRISCIFVTICQATSETKNILVPKGARNFSVH